MATRENVAHITYSLSHDQDGVCVIHKCGLPWQHANNSKLLQPSVWQSEGLFKAMYDLTSIMYIRK